MFSVTEHVRTLKTNECCFFVYARVLVIFANAVFSLLLCIPEWCLS